MTIHATVQQLTQMLKNLNAFLDKAQVFAEQKGFDVNNLAGARLAPDQFPLTRQVQTACDTAKFIGSRLSGKDAPVNEDNEKTVEELKARIAATVAYLEGFEASDFEGGEQRKVKLPFLPGRYALGEDYLRQFAQPNFYFHLTTAYAILRHNGVDLGKRDFIAHMTTHADEA